jgi:hypothetical protein
MSVLSPGQSPVTAAMHVVLGGRVRIQLTEDLDPSRRSGQVVDEDGKIIGSATSYPYGASGFSVFTEPFAGFVPTWQVEFV